MKSHDIFDKFKSEEGYFGDLRRSRDTYFCNPILPPNPHPHTTFQGKPVISWSINNYLGLANHPTIQKVAQKSVAQYGLSSPMGSRMLTGTTEHHISLENELAQFAHKEAAYLFNYGYLGVVGTICAMVSAHDTIVVDKLAHACIIDGAILSRATMRIFKHNDMEDLEHILRRISHRQRIRRGGVLIAVEGVYGMTGDIANLPRICELAHKYGARLFVDDAHGWGVMGDHGRGVGEFYGVQEKIDLYFGTFAKSFAAIGGMTATTQEARDWIAFNARTQVFAKALPLVYVETLRSALKLVMNAADTRAHLWSIANRIKEELQSNGYVVGKGKSPICTVFIPLPYEHAREMAMRITKWMRGRGIYVSGITYPVIPRGLVMFRMVPTTMHTNDDVSETVSAFKKMRTALNIDTEIPKEELARIERIYANQN